MLRRHVAVPLFAVLALSLASCSHAPPPAERVQAVAQAAPPAPRRETRGNAPHAGYVWVGGYWNRVNGQYVWVPGYWGVPPQGFSSWEPSHWVQDKTRGWVLVRGRWK